MILSLLMTFSFPEPRSFWPVAGIKSSGRTWFSEHVQSISFIFSANQICQIWLKSVNRGLRCWTKPELSIPAAGLKDRGSGDDANESDFPFNLCGKNSVVSVVKLLNHATRDVKSFLSPICLISIFKHHCAQERWQEPLWKGEVLYNQISALESRFLRIREDHWMFKMWYSQGFLWWKEPL